MVREKLLVVERHPEISYEGVLELSKIMSY